MKEKKLKADEVKLQPVSNEEVQQILNENPLAAAYGCGSGCGCGGTGCGCGDGSGDGSGSGSGGVYPKKTENGSDLNDSMESSKTDFYGKFKIVAICKASAYAVAEKYTEYDDWHITIQFGSFSFSIANSEESDGVDKNGNRLTYKLTGDSRNNIPLLGERNESASETCELTCKCEYPNGETMSLVVTLTAEISTFFNESSQNHKIGFRLGEPSISVRKK